MSQRNHTYRILLPLALTLLLAGCAAQMAYRDGQTLLEKGELEKGLGKLHEASMDEPHNAQYRLAYLQTRERMVNTYLDLADRQATSGHKDAAAQAYQRALALDENNQRAHTGLQALDTGARAAKWLDEANAALNSKDIETAKLKLSNILMENPAHVLARTLLRSLTESSNPPAIESRLASKYKKPISIEFKDATLQQMFDVISRSSGLNFLFDREIKTDQKNSIYLKNSTVESAIHFLLWTNQLEQQIMDDSTILIYPNTVSKKAEYQEMVVRSFFLANAEAKAVASTLKSIIKTRDIVIDEKLNMLIMRDSPEAIRLAEKLIALQDVAEPEVMLEVEVLEIGHSRLQQLGIQWPATLGLTPLVLNTTPTTATSNGTSIASATGLTLNNLLHLNRNSIGAALGSTTVNANVQDSDSNLLANPRIRVRNHEKAKIMIGERVPNVTTTSTATGFASESVSYLDVGLTLNVEPNVYLDNDVGIKVSLEVSNVIGQIKTQSGTAAYEIGTRTASTALRLKDGETQVLAGLISDQDRHSGNKIPGLGEFPLLGHLFGERTTNRQKSEIVLAITPHLIRNIQRPNLALMEFRAGTDTSLRNRPETGSGAQKLNSAPTSTPVAAAELATASATASAPPGTMAQGASGASGNAFGTGIGSNNSGNTSAPYGAASVSADAVGGSFGGSAISGRVQLSWQGPAQVKVGDIIALSLMLQSTLAVNSLPLSISFDNKVLLVVDVSEGDFLKHNGASTNFNSDIDPNGTIRISNAISGVGIGASALGTIASINFRALAAVDATSVKLMNITPIGVNGTAIPAPLPAPYSVNVKP